MSHPYAEFENTKLWKAIDVAIADLERNTDIKLETVREYVIGSLCKQLMNDKVVTYDSVVKSNSD